MANIGETLKKLLEIDGAMASALVDATSGMMLGSAGSGVDLEVAAAGNTEVVRAKMKTMKALGLNDRIEDMLITLTDQIHLIKMVSKATFLYLAVDRSQSNLAIVRSAVAKHAAALS